MSSNEPDREGGPDAEKPVPEPKPLDVDSAFAAIVAGWANDSPATWPAQEDLSAGRHRRPDDEPADRTPEPPREQDDDRPDDDQLAPVGAGGTLIPSVEQGEAGPEDAIGRADAFVPPEPPPIPRGDLIGRLAWGGVLFGPLFLLFSVLFWQDVSNLLMYIALGGFVGGFLTLVARMPTQRDDDGDDGARV